MADVLRLSDGEAGEAENRATVRAVKQKRGKTPGGSLDNYTPLNISAFGGKKTLKRRYISFFITAH